MKPTTPQQQQAPQIAEELIPIVEEVEKHGFSAGKINEFIIKASNRDEIARYVAQSAKHAHLKVSFNFDAGICLFEREDIQADDVQE